MKLILSIFAAIFIGLYIGHITSSTAQNIGDNYFDRSDYITEFEDGSWRNELTGETGCYEGGLCQD